MSSEQKTSARSFRWEMDELRIVVGAMVILSLATALLVVMPYLLLKDIPPPTALKPYTELQLVGRQSYMQTDAFIVIPNSPAISSKHQMPREDGEEPQLLQIMPLTRPIF
jgi:hypothetical protein